MPDQITLTAVVPAPVVLTPAAPVRITLNPLIGLRGPQGPSGDLNYAVTWNSPVTSVVITHHLGKNPSVTVVDSAGNLMNAGVVYTTPGAVVTINFAQPFGPGTAFLN